MKKILLLLLTSLQLSCSFYQGYYQVYTLDAPDATISNKVLLFSNEACNVMYNLWDESGTLTFIVTNTLDKDIHIDLSNSFFIHNGLSYNYTDNAKMISGTITRDTRTIYQDLISQPLAFTKAEWPTISSSVITIPPGASSPIYGFKLSTTIRQTDDAHFNYPNQESDALEYTRDNTPLHIRNRLSFIVDGNRITEEHQFWVTEIKNFSGDYFIKNFKKYQAAYNFYNSYTF